MANLVNIVGINNMGGTPRPVNPAQFNAPQMPTVDVSRQPQYQQVQDVTDAKYQQVREDKEREYQAYIDQINAEGARKKAELEKRGMNPRTSSVGSILTTVGAAMLEWHGQREEKKAAEAEQQQRLTAFEARQALEQVFNSSQDRLLQMGDEEGMTTLEHDMNRILRQYGDLPPDLIEPLWEWSGSVLRDIKGSVAGRMREEAEEAVSANIRMTRSLIQAEISPRLVAIQYGRFTQAQIDQEFDSIFGEIERLTEGRDPTERFEIIEPLLNSMIAASSEGSREYMAAQQRISDMNSAFAEIEAGREAYGHEPHLWLYYLSSIGEKYPSIRDLIGRVPSNLDLESTFHSSDSRNRERAQWQIEDQREQQRQNNLSPGTVTDWAYGWELAWSIQTEGNIASYESIKRRPADEITPAEAFAVARVDEWRKAEEEYKALQEKLSLENEQFVQWYAENGQPRMFVDPVTGQQRPLLDENNQPVVNQYTAEEISARMQRQYDITAQIDALVQRTQRSGYNLANPSDRSQLTRLVEQALASADDAQERDALSTGAGITQPTPPQGGTSQSTGAVDPASPRGVMRRSGIPGFNWGLDSPPPGYQIQVPPVNRLTRIDDPQYGSIPLPIADNLVPHNVVSAARNRIGTDFLAGLQEQCANFVRDVLNQAGVDVGVTDDPIDQLDTNPALANSFFGSDVGEIISDANALQPGDIVGFHNTYGDWAPGTITHVGIYTGNGMVVDRSTAGEPVREISLNNWGSFIAVRPDSYYGRNQRNINITSEYGMRSIFGEHRMHWGIDIDTGDLYDRDTGAVAMSGGYVIAVEDANDYGGTVAILTGEGYTEQYNHLRSFFVKPGDFVAPGTPLGLIGGDPSDPMAGQTTGRHLHFQVWRPGYDWIGTPSEESTIDPITYLSTIQTVESVSQGVGAPPRVAPAAHVPTPNTMPLGVGTFISPDFRGRFPELHGFMEEFGMPASWMYGSSYSQTGGNVNPIPQGAAPIQREAYPERNDPTANYGYEVLAQDREFAKALAEVSDYIGIPAQWLADIMEAESGFSQTVVNQIGATGLIQFIPETMAGLGYTREQIQGMSRAEQTRTIVRDYLNQFRGQYRTIEDVYESIYAGSVTDPETRRSFSDGQSSFPEMIQRFGASVNRRYRSSYDLHSSIMHTHETFQPGCAMCQQMMNRVGEIVPHEAFVA